MESNPHPPSEGNGARSQNESDKHSYGWFRFFLPNPFQLCCTHPYALLASLSAASFMQGFIVNGTITVVISTIERRFGLASFTSGLIVSAYDIGYVLFCLPVSFIGGQGHKGRWISAGAVFMALGAMLFSLPHFIADTYRQEGNGLTLDETCHAGRNLTDVCSTEDTQGHVQATPTNTVHKYIFFIANFIVGCGSAPLYTVGITYIVDNVPKEKLASLFIGIYYAMSILGPAMGFLLTGQFLKISTNLTEDEPVDETSDNFVGAWWLSFVVASALCLLIALKVSGYPKLLRCSYKIDRETDLTTAIDPSSRSVAVRNSTDSMCDKKPLLCGDTAKNPLHISFFFEQMKNLLTNGTYMCLNLAGATEGLLLNGFTAFGPKLVEVQYGFSASSSAFIFGCIAAPCGAGGSFLGGYVLKRFNMGLHKALQLLILLSLSGAICGFCVIISCREQTFAQITISSNNSISRLTNSCNAPCQCQNSPYNPVCDEKRSIRYYSPCHAGCLAEKNHTHTSDRKCVRIFTGCQCMLNSTGALTTERGLVSTKPCATAEKCETESIIFFIVFVFLLLTTFIMLTPAISATIWSVEESEQSFGVGMQWVIVRLLGTIPAPPLLGAVFDQACILWVPKEVCENVGDDSVACRLYNNGSLSTMLVIIVVAGKSLTTVVLVLSLFLLKRRKKAEKKKLAGTENRRRSSALSAQDEAHMLVHRISSIPPPDNVLKEAELQLLIPVGVQTLFQELVHIFPRKKLFAVTFGCMGVVQVLKCSYMEENENETSSVTMSIRARSSSVDTDDKRSLLLVDASVTLAIDTCEHASTVGHSCGPPDERRTPCASPGNGTVGTAIGIQRERILENFYEFLDF